MSAYLNKVQLIGRLGAKPEVCESNGKTYAGFSIAINEPVKKGDEWQTVTQWQQLVLFGKLTRVCEHLDKGSLVYVEGRLRTRDWQDTEGNQKRQVNIVVSNLQILDSSKTPATENGDTSNVAKKHLNELKEMVESDTFIEDVPF